MTDTRRGENKERQVVFLKQSNVTHLRILMETDKASVHERIEWIEKIYGNLHVVTFEGMVSKICENIRDCELTLSVFETPDRKEDIKNFGLMDEYEFIKRTSEELYETLYKKYETSFAEDGRDVNKLYFHYVELCSKKRDRLYTQEKYTECLELNEKIRHTILGDSPSSEHIEDEYGDDADLLGQCDEYQKKLLGKLAQSKIDGLERESIVRTKKSLQPLRRAIHGKRCDQIEKIIHALPDRSDRRIDTCFIKEEKEETSKTIDQSLIELLEDKACNRTVFTLYIYRMLAIKPKTEKWNLANFIYEELDPEKMLLDDFKKMMGELSLSAINLSDRKKAKKHITKALKLKKVEPVQQERKIEAKVEPKKIEPVPVFFSYKETQDKNSAECLSFVLSLIAYLNKKGANLDFIENKAGKKIDISLKGKKTFSLNHEGENFLIQKEKFLSRLKDFLEKEGCLVELDNDLLALRKVKGTRLSADQLEKLTQQLLEKCPKVKTPPIISAAVTIEDQPMPSTSVSTPSSMPSVSSKGSPKKDLYHPVSILSDDKLLPAKPKSPLVSSSAYIMHDLSLLTDSGGEEQKKQPPLVVKASPASSKVFCALYSSDTTWSSDHSAMPETDGWRSFVPG